MSETHLIPFLFATCNPGWEGPLKAEVRRRYGGDLTPAFLRPGLVTWKVVGGRAEVPTEPLPVFAHVFGRSLGMAGDESEIPGFAASLGPGPFHLHVFPRVLPGDGFPEEDWMTLDAREADLARRLEAAGLTLHRGNPPGYGEPVLDVILGEPGEAIFVGTHRHDRHSSPYPGGMPRAVLPAVAPSRAWLKMEQGLAYLGLGAPESLRGCSVLELGSAPGGGSHALLTHGARVLGVDTGSMDERILAFKGAEGAGFTHLAVSAGEIDFEDLPARIDLLASDMNLAPPVALRYIERLQKRLKAPALVLTLKINDARMEAEIPLFVERVRRFFRGEILATQLPANRREITILGRSRRVPAGARR